MPGATADNGDFLFGQRLAEFFQAPAACLEYVCVVKSGMCGSYKLTLPSRNGRLGLALRIWHKSHALIRALMLRTCARTLSPHSFLLLEHSFQPTPSPLCRLASWPLLGACSMYLRVILDLTLHLRRTSNTHKAPSMPARSDARRRRFDPAAHPPSSTRSSPFTAASAAAEARRRGRQAPVTPPWKSAALSPAPPPLLSL